MKFTARYNLFFASSLIVACMFGSAKAVVTVDDTDTLVTTSGSSTYTLSGFDATASDKLVVTISSEGNGSTKAITGVSYGGRLLHEAAQATHSTGSQTTGIYYLDAPTTAGDIVVNWSGGVNGTGIAAMALSDTAPGFALANGNDGTSVNLTTTIDNTFAVASFVANSGSTSAVAPLTEIYAADVGSAGGAAGYQNVPTAASTTFNFTGSSSRPVSVAAGFTEGVTAFGPFEELAAQTFENPASGLNFTVTGLDGDISDGSAWAELTDITGGSPNVSFTGAEGADYIYGQRIQNTAGSITFDAVDLSSISDPRLEIALAANTGVWDSSPDELLILLDKDNDGTFETTVADFLGTGNSDLVFNSEALGLEFQNFEFLLPEDATNAALRIDFITSNDAYEIVGIDNIRFSGRQALSSTIPEPSTFVLAALGLIGLAWFGRRQYGNFA